MVETFQNYLPLASTPQGYFDDVYSEFQQSESAFGESIDHFLRIGSFTIRLRFAGPALVPYFTPAFEHLVTLPNHNPSLTVCIWDSLSTNSKSISPPIHPEDYHPLGQVRGKIGSRLFIDYKCESNSLSLLDLHQKLGIFWVQDVTRLSPAETAVPLRNILFWWGRQHGFQFLHAGAVGTTEGAAVVVGKSGSGKSTTTMTCLFAGMQYLGDDNILVDTEPFPTAFSLYNSAKIDPDLSQRLSTIMPANINPDNASIDKWIYFLCQHLPNQLPPSLPVKAIVFPKIAGSGSTKLTSASHGAILKALAPSTIVLLSGAGPVDFQAIASFVKRAACYSLEIGNDLKEIPGVIQGIIDGRNKI